MSFVENLKTEANYTKTLNGAKTHGTSGDGCLDFFAVAGGMRYKKADEQIRLFEKAYIENPDLAMKLLFHVRDIWEGMGERDLFRNIIRHVAKTWPKSAKKNVAYIPEFGRFDDLMCLMRTPAEKEVVELIKTQLEKDCAAVENRKNGEIDAHISLLAKWMPSINASSARTRGQAKVLANALGMSEKEYRKTLSMLRAHIGLSERYLTAKNADKISYESVPAGAMLKYRNAFAKNDGDRFNDYLVEVAAGEKNIHCSNLYPYEIIRPFIKSGWTCNLRNDVKGLDTLEALWDNQKAEVNGKNAISVIDVSGSMYCTRNGGVMPALISQSLGLYYAERCTGTFHNMFITFESTPHLVEIHGTTLMDKLRYIQKAGWGGSTNLEAVFDLILRTAVNANTPQEEMPATLYIISDMEFNMATGNADMTVYEAAKKKFEAAGYQLPAVVFHNVNSWHMQVPVKAHTKGTALVSGAGTNSFKHDFDGNITPMEHMLRVLNGPRYEKVCA